MDIFLTIGAACGILAFLMVVFEAVSTFRMQQENNENIDSLWSALSAAEQAGDKQVNKLTTSIGELGDVTDTIVDRLMILEVANGASEEDLLTYGGEFVTNEHIFPMHRESAEEYADLIYGPKPKPRKRTARK